MPAFGFSSHVISDLSEYDAEVILSLAIMRPTRGDPQSDTQDDTQGDTQGGTQSGTQEENLDKWVENQIEKNGGDCYSKTEQTVTVLMAQN